ncbi:MAG TPA: hypothetical protein VFS16_04170 [Acidimicrobiia bacterium]|nr:hypothetical protein [Acidimicrobiia bacterium]
MIGAAALLAAATFGVFAPAGSPSAGASPSLSLAVFDGFAASQSIFMEPRSNAIFALPANQLIGATHAEINSQPRAQGYAATWGVPLAQNARGVGIPVDYYGQCYANYPGEAKVECGIPFSKDPAPTPPSGGGFSGTAFKAHAEASGGTDGSHDDTRASGITEAGGMTGGEAFRIGWNRSESKSYLENGVLHAVTSSVAQDVTIGGVLHIGSVEARAEAVHPGALAEATGEAATVMQNVTIGGVPVTIGPAGVLVQGQPLGQAPTPVTKPILDAMASHGMTIEPLPAPRLTRDEGTGLLEAASDGFLVSLQSPNGDAKFEMVFGRALARAGAVRAADDTPFDLSAGSGQPVPLDNGDAGTAASAPAEVSFEPVADPVPTLIGTPASARRAASAFSAFDPVAGSVAPAPAPEPTAATAEVAAAAPAPATLAVQPATLARDLSSRVLSAYVVIFSVVLAGLAFAVGRRPRRFGAAA